MRPRSRFSPSRLLLFLLQILGSCAPHHQEVAGDWIGAVRTGMTWHAARLRLEQSDAGLSGTADIMGLNVLGVPVDGTISRDRFQLRLAARGLSEIPFEGRMLDGALRSDTRQWRGPGVNFVRATTLPEEALREYAGWYEGDVAGRVVVMPGSEGGLRFFNLGRLSGTLLPTSRDAFAQAYLDQASTTLTVQARFTRGASGRVTGLDIGDDPVENRTALKRVAQPPYGQERFAFRNGKVSLRGVLFSPEGGGPHPAVVFIHGTGYATADRPYEMSLLYPFLDRGIAVLLFDKRGCGKSTGDWRTASLEDLAGDVGAAVEALRCHPSIAPFKIGVYGISEGGWVAPIVAGTSRLAFLVNQGGPAVPPLEDEIDDLTAGVGRLGLPPSEHAVALDLARAWVELYRSPEAMPRYLAALEAARQRPWFGPIEDRLPTSEDDWEVQWWRKRGRLDPLPHWTAVDIPALVLIGENDDTMSCEKNIALFKKIGQSAASLDVRVVSGADHGLRVQGAVAPGILEEVADWILDVVR